MHYLPEAKRPIKPPELAKSKGIVVMVTPLRIIPFAAIVRKVCGGRTMSDKAVCILSSMWTAAILFSGNGKRASKNA